MLYERSNITVETLESVLYILFALGNEKDKVIASVCQGRCVRPLFLFRGNYSQTGETGQAWPKKLVHFFRQQGYPSIVLHIACASEQRQVKFQHFAGICVLDLAHLER